MPETTAGQIKFYSYNTDEYSFEGDFTLEQFDKLESKKHVNWINIITANNTGLVHKAADVFKFHPLITEDILNVNQRAKIESYGDSQFVVIRMFAIINNRIEDQQVAFVLRDNIIISFREEDYGILKKSIEDKIISNIGPIRKKGEDFLFYSLLDTIIDNYYLVLNFLNEKIETLNAEILRKSDTHQMVDLQQLKSDVLYIRKHIMPVRDLINTLSRNDIDYFEEENRFFIRDLQDHMVRNVEEIEFHRDQLSGLLDLYYSLQENKMNTVMKTLTGISFVLLPLNFLASLYGMNFSKIPHADDENGFWEMVGIMALVALILITIAIRFNWLSSKDFGKNKDA